MKLIIDDTINQFVDKKLIEENQEKELNHKSSGKLSASMLGFPLQWQILKAVKAPAKPNDAYTLRKFLRGTTVEDWLVENIPGVIDTQVFSEYKNCIGYADILVDQSEY